MPDVAEGYQTWKYYQGITLKREHNLSTTTKHCLGKPFLEVDFNQLSDAIIIVNRKWKSGWICTQIITADKTKNLKVIDKLDVIYSEIFFKWKFLNFYRQLNMSDLKRCEQSFFSKLYVFLRQSSILLGYNCLDIFRFIYWRKCIS